MQLNPRYGTDPLITLDGSPAAILEPAVRQRRRLAATVATLTDEQWAHPSRCDGWSSRDVIVHLDTTNSFWAFSIAQGLKGEPTQFLATFDPVASPAQMVADAGDVSADEVLDRFVASTDSAHRPAHVARHRGLDGPGRVAPRSRQHQRPDPPRPLGLVGPRAGRPASVGDPAG